MADSPFSVYRLLRQHLLASARPAYLVMDKNFNLISASGDLDYYDLSTLEIGKTCDASLNFLVSHDMAEALELRFFQINKEVIAHIVLLPHEGRLIILFMDASAAYQQEQEVQQKANEVLILSEKQDELVKQLVKTRDNLAIKHEELAEANGAKAKFITNLADDIKSPLTSILGHSSLLKNDLGDSPEQVKMIEAIERSGRHLLILVENLLDQMHLELSDVKLKLVPLDINNLLLDLDAIFSPVAQRKDLEFSIIRDSIPPNRIKIDEIRLRQVLVNLLNNAFKYTEMGSIKLTVGWKDNNLYFEVYDSGRGIPESFQNKMFSAFNQHSNGQIHDKEQGKGKGLGLSIAKHFVELMGGKISCQSTLGVETRFSLLIPSELDNSEALEKSIIENLDFGGDAHILVIDSNEDLCQLYELALSKAGFVVSQCQSTEVGIEIAKRKKPGLILIGLDTQADGLDAIKQIRDSSYNEPILAQISMESSIASRAVFEAGGNGFITKPINIIDLIETIKAYVSPTQTDDSDISMRSYLRERFNEYLNVKSRYLAIAVSQLIKGEFDFEASKELEKEVTKIVLTAETYGYGAITNVAKLIDDAFKNHADYSEDEFLVKLLECLKILYAEILLVLEK